MAQKISALPVLAKVRDTQTTYYGAVIDWVIGDKNHDGYPENSVTLVSEHILTLKCFDAKEGNIDGNDRYAYSNIRQWLNKGGTGWYVKQHEDDTPPSSSYVYNGLNAYESEAGFKSGFGSGMLAAILPTTLIVAKGESDKGGTETLTDDIFLLSLDEVGQRNNGIAEGVALAMFSEDKSRMCKPTAQAVSNSEYKSSGLHPSTPWYWWTRSAKITGRNTIVGIGSSGSLYDDSPYYTARSGVLPTLNVSAETLVSEEPDSEGYYTLILNNAPTSPLDIAIPETVQGGTSIDVAWSASIDSDNDLTGYELAGYELERQVDSGEWTPIYTGEATGYTDAITRGWLTVAYRVRAYDSYGATSDYTTSPTREVNNNRAPAIVCAPVSGTDLGVKGEGFSISYSASDADGDPVTVTEAIDGVTLRTFTPEAEEACAFSVTGETFMKLLNGTHELAITASDGQAQAVHTLTFTKSVTAASITLAEPMEADGPITLCVLSVTGSIPEDADYSVKVTNNALDSDPVWEDCTDEVKLGANHVFANETAANGFAFNFLVSVERGESGQGGCINSVQGGFQ